MVHDQGTNEQPEGGVDQGLLDQLTTIHDDDDDDDDDDDLCLLFIQGTEEKIAEHERDEKFHFGMVLDHSLMLSQEIKKQKALLNVSVTMVIEIDANGCMDAKNNCNDAEAAAGDDEQISKYQMMMMTQNL